jgi:hypothetical protein
MMRLSHLSLALLLLPQCCWGFLSSSSRSLSFVSSPSTSNRLQAATAITIGQSDVLAVPQDQSSSIDTPKVGVLLLNLGGPETGDDVEGT